MLLHVRLNVREEDGAVVQEFLQRAVIGLVDEPEVLNFLSEFSQLGVDFRLDLFNAFVILIWQIIGPF